MQQKQYISKVQAFFLAMFSFAGINIYAAPIVYVADGRSGWITDIAGTLVLIPRL
jgi:hypothetical protein